MSVHNAIEYDFKFSALPCYLCYIYIHLFEFVHSIYTYIMFEFVHSMFKKIFHAWNIIVYICSIYRHTHIYTYSPFIFNKYFFLCVCMYIPATMMIWAWHWRDEMYDVLQELLVLKFWKTRVSLECICILWLTSDLWVPSNIPFSFISEI